MMLGSTMIVGSPYQVAGRSLVYRIDTVDQVERMSGAVASLVRFGRQDDPIQYVSSMMHPRLGLNLQKNEACLHPT